LALPAQISFTPDGTQLLVTEKGTNLIDSFQVRSDGKTAGATALPSSGKTPFGFAFGSSGSVVVSEVQNRFPTKATASSYQLTEGSGLQPVTATVPDNQSGACWVATTGDTAWIVNTGTAVISAYQIGAGGSLALLNSEAATTGDATSPIDVAASSDGQFLYLLKSATGEIAAFRINGTSLEPLFTEGGLPLSIQGLVAR
jgi:6-phosphogluconolactonase (cycloisomerase 2 family)